jgi:hypothetical protein
MFLSVFVASHCDASHNDDGICQIPFPVFPVLVDNSTSRK